MKILNKIISFKRPVLILRKDVPETLFGYYYTLYFKGKKYSVVNFSYVKDDNHNQFQFIGYSSWESMDNKNNIIRANTFNKLISLLNNPSPLN